MLESQIVISHTFRGNLSLNLGYCDLFHYLGGFVNLSGAGMPCWILDVLTSRHLRFVHQQKLGMRGRPFGNTFKATYETRKPSI